MHPALLAPRCRGGNCSTTPAPSNQAPSSVLPYRHFLELDGASAEHLAAHQGRKTVGGIAIHALGSSLAHHLGQEAPEQAEAPASVHGAPVSAKV